MPTSAADRLLVLRDAVVEQMLQRYEPLRRLGERGTAFCRTDTGYHLEALGSAVEIGVPELFGSYTAWVLDVLKPRGIPSGALELNFELVGALLDDAGLSAVERSLAARAIVIGLGVTRGDVALSDPAPPPGAFVAQAYLDAALAGDARKALVVVATVAMHHGVTEALRQIGRAQHQVGELWLAARISVADEHRATGIAHSAIGSLVAQTVGAAHPRDKGRAVVACAPGDWHWTGPRIAADLLDLQGYEVDFLWASTPVADLASTCAQRAPALVGIGVAPLACLPAARDAITAARRACPNARFVAGGRAARIAGAAALGVDEVVSASFGD